MIRHGEILGMRHETRTMINEWYLDLDIDCWRFRTKTASPRYANDCEFCTAESIVYIEAVISVKRNTH